MNSKKLTNILALSLVAVIVIYLIMSVAKGIGSSYKTSTAYVQTVSETIDAKMFIIREETVITSDGSGVVVPLAVNGERVGSGSSIAAVFGSSADAENHTKSIALTKKLETYRKINNQVKLANLDLKKLSQDIYDEFNSILSCAYDNDFSSLSEKERSFSEMLSRKDISLGYEVDCSEIISSLEDEIASLNVKSPKEYVSAQSSGYFVSRLDGYEDVITTDDIDKLTPEKLEEALDAEKAEAPDGVMGKLITGYDWYAAAIVDTALLAGTEVRKGVQLLLGDKAGDMVSAVVYDKVKVEGEDSTMVIFKCSEMNEDLATARKVAGKIVLKNYSGIKLKKSAVHFNEKGDEGVFIIEGNIIKFNRIEEIYSDEDYVIVRDNTGKPGYLAQYDEVVTSGKELYNGKVIS